METPGKSRFRLWVATCAMIDLVWPCAGRALLHRPPAGRWGMIWWMGFLVILSMWTISMMINALQALLVAAVIWATVQIHLQTRNIESIIRGPCPGELADFERRFSGRKLSILLILLVYVVTPTVFLGRAEKRLAILTVNDFGTFPSILPGESLLVLKSGTRPARAGELVVFNSEHGTMVGRVVATAGRTVSVAEGGVVIDGVPLPATSPEPIAFDNFRLTETESTEARDLMVFSEFSGEGINPAQVFIRKDAVVNRPDMVVPEGSVYVIADNRSTTHSTDSRFIGPISTSNIAGQPLFVLWSAGAGPFGRIDRVGSFPR